MSALALMQHLACHQTAGRARLEALVSAPVLSVEWPPNGGGPRLLIDEGVTTVCLEFFYLEELLAFQHNLAHLIVPSDPHR